jgi:hypothetical protein
MPAFFLALLLVGIYSAVLCHLNGNSAFSRMTVARSDADSDACEAEWKRWRQLQLHISYGIVAVICALAQVCK